jgi:hypothetical protein
MPPEPPPDARAAVAPTAVIAPASKIALKELRMA